MARFDKTYEAAKQLWSFESLDLTPAEFQSQLDAIYSIADRPATYWRLGGAANDYLRRHPGTIVVPVDLAPRLLAAPFVDGRIIGLKLLNRCSSEVSLIVESIRAALRSPDEHERLGGIHELGLLVDRPCVGPAIPLAELIVQLTPKMFANPEMQAYADRVRSWLVEHAEAKTRN